MQTDELGQGSAPSRVKRAAIYTRSFQAKVLREKPLAEEVERCQAHCARYGYIIENEQIYYEVQSDGDEQGQPELSRLLAAAQRGDIDVVVVTGPGRLSSSPAELITIIQQFHNLGVKVETIEPSFLDRYQLTKGDYSQSTRRYCHKKRSKWTEYQMIGQTASQQLNSQRHIAIYAKGDTLSVQQQIKQCKAYCTRNSYSIDLNQVYSDLREHIDEQDRWELNPALNRLIEAAKNGLIDSIVLTNVQMFTRRPSYLATILQVFQDIGVQVVTLE